MINVYWPLIVSYVKARKKAIAAWAVSLVVLQVAKHGVSIDTTWQEIAKSALEALIVAIPVHQVRNT